MIQENMVVSISYVLKDQSGNVLDESSKEEPIVFLQGHKNIIPGLEKALSGLKTGDRKNVEIPPDEGYGQYDPDLKFVLEAAQFEGQDPQTGMTVQLTSPEGEAFRAQVIEVRENVVILDANHPLAGQSLFFDVEITEVRQATEEEIAHGHPHGPNGHH